MSGVSKIVAERNQRILLELVSQPGNDICADCKGKAPRWASHNLGIFICVRCASIHRKIGTHVTKVKSLTLDSWSKEQVENMGAIGNIKANEYWHPDRVRHPPPTNMEESERDSELEKYIRSKYEYKRYRPPSARAAEQLGESRSLSSLPPRSRTAPVRSGTSPIPGPSRPAQPPIPTPSTSQPYSPAIARSGSAGLTTSLTDRQVQPQLTSFAQSVKAPSMNPPVPAAPPNQQASLTSSTFNDLIAIQSSTTNSSLPLQYQAAPTLSLQTQPMSFAAPPPASSPSFSSPSGSASPYAALSVTPSITGASFPSSFSHTSDLRSASLPVWSQTSTNMLPTSIFQQPMQTGMAPNPFTQQYTGMSPNIPGQPQSLISNTFAAQPLQPDSMAESPNSSFRQNAMRFGTQPGAYQTQQQPAQATHTNEGFNASSPYAQQAQQAQQLFQNMAGGNNPFGSQWHGSQ
ncbi:ArfGap-domain-containing protein [Phellopilus nigrolimitatus]|nr:ArfGap-domain-containing protein [Phellopilus nigrolimitatus]